MTIKNNHELQQVINAHWNYVDDVLALHGVDNDEREIIEFHYMSAFKHGYKHAVQDCGGKLQDCSTYADEFKIDSHIHESKWTP